MSASWTCSCAKHHLMHPDSPTCLILFQVRIVKSTDLKLAHFPTLSPLPVAALPSMSLIPSAPFADSRRCLLPEKPMQCPLICENLCYLWLNSERLKMKISKIIWFAVSAMMAATAMGADETLIVSNVLGPEVPLYVDGNLYYVGWVSNMLSKWDGKSSTVLNHAPV